MQPQFTEAQIIEISALSERILKLCLAPEPYLPYQAGQYLQLSMLEQSLSYSIANAPLCSKTYELHIRHSQESQIYAFLAAKMKKKQALKLYLPLGQCHFQCLDSQRPILFVAWGTGFAPIKALIEQLVAQQDKRSFELFWGARTSADLYLEAAVKAWQKEVPHFRYFSSTTNQKDWVESVLKHHPPETLKTYQVVIAGPFDLDYAIRDQLVLQGLPEAQCFSDAFHFEQKR